MHTKYCNYALGVRTNSSNIAVRGELGSLPLLYNILINMIKYWCYLVKDNKFNKLLNGAVNEATIKIKIHGWGVLDLFLNT